MDRFFVFILGSVVAFLILRYRRPIKEFTGDIGFAEHYLGSGGTNTFIAILGILVFIFSLMYAVGTLQSFVQGTIGRLFF